MHSNEQKISERGREEKEEGGKKRMNGRKERKEKKKYIRGLWNNFRNMGTHCWSF
jgi:hypothetical protein